MQCTGEEENLLNCTYTQDHYCSHYEDASVECLEANCTEGDVRLVGGVQKTGGYVEICFDGSWHAVCSYFWSYNDARVVCKQLGYPYSGTINFLVLNLEGLIIGKYIKLVKLNISIYLIEASICHFA